MSWRTEIEKIIEGIDREYEYLPSGDDFDPEFPLFPVFGVIRISHPLKHPITFKQEGNHNFVILPRGRIRRTPIVIIDNTNPKRHLHGDLSRTRNVLAAGEVKSNEKMEVAGLSPRSGHYTPLPSCLDVAEQIMTVYEVPFASNYKRYPV